MNKKEIVKRAKEIVEIANKDLNGDEYMELGTEALNLLKEIVKGEGK